MCAPFTKSSLLIRSLFCIYSHLVSRDGHYLSLSCRYPNEYTNLLTNELIRLWAALEVRAKELCSKKRRMLTRSFSLQGREPAREEVIAHSRLTYKAERFRYWYCLLFYLECPTDRRSRSRTCKNEVKRVVLKRDDGGGLLTSFCIRTQIHKAIKKAKKKNPRDCRRWCLRFLPAGCAKVYM